MPIKRAIISAILALSTAGSILAGSAVSLMATQAPSAVVATASSMRPDYLLHG